MTNLIGHLTFLRKIAIILNQIKKKSVLLNTGGHNPMHIGHLKLMDRAKTLLESKGYQILAMYLSPSSDYYVSSKEEWETAYPRVNVANLTINSEEDSQIRIGMWEARKPCRMLF